MADGLGRYQHPGAGAGQFFPNQHNYQYPQRHNARNRSPVNNGRGSYANDTPSPSRSPVSQASSHNHYSMYNPGNQQGQHVMMNGHQRFMQQGPGNKFQQQSYQQHHEQQNHHHQQNHGGTQGVGHQHTFSSGALSNSTSHSAFNNIHNGHANNAQGGINDNFPQNPSWQRQLQLAAESRQEIQPNHHAKKDGAVSLKSRVIDQPPAEEVLSDGEDDRHRPVMNNDNSRQDWNSLDLSAQGLRSLSRSLFEYGFLTRLYLDDNRLPFLDPVIGKLRRLTHLDISNNDIRVLPEEIGMLVNLKELLAFDNKLETLPREIGNLFRLETLGIEGNSKLDDEFKERIMRDGTKSLITYVRETAEPGPPPNDRDKVIIDESSASEVLGIMSYNILCDKYATTAQYGYTASRDLAWEHRKFRILEEIRSHDADIVCLQEIDRESFDEFFRRELAMNDYRGVFWPKSRARTMVEKEARLVDGCATFYKGGKYVLLDKALVDFANIAINRLDMKGEHDLFNRVMPRDHIAVLSFLENRMTGSRMIVGNAHLLWDPEFADVKLVQVAILMEQLEKHAEKWAKHPPCTDKAAFRHSDVDSEANTEPGDEPASEPSPSLEYASGPHIPLIICGDFNCAADSGVYELITTGSVPGNHADMGNRGYGSFTQKGMTHPFKLKSAYNTPDELAFTNYTPTFTGILDYIWYSTSALQVRELLGNVDEAYLQKVPGFPNHWFPSDHIALKAEFSVKPRKETKTVEAGNSTQRG
ncbi:Glucose-repressible alcohol dehydrogenase transcriptional effector [Lecanora helva]